MNISRIDFVSDSKSNAIVINEAFCKNHSLTANHAYYHSSMLFDQISYFHGKQFKASNQLCPNENLDNFGIDYQLFNDGDTLSFQRKFSTRKNCKPIDYGFQTTYNLRTGRFSQHKHFFPLHTENQDFLRSIDFQLVQIGYFIWFVGGYIPQVLLSLNLGGTLYSLLLFLFPPITNMVFTVQFSEY